MRTSKELGKIDSVSFGIGGYQDAMIGLHIGFSGPGWGCGTSKSAWSPVGIPCSPGAKWTEVDRDKQLVEIMRFVDKLLANAKVKSVDKLKGIPVEVTFEDGQLTDWRILTEVL